MEDLDEYVRLSQPLSREDVLSFERQLKTNREDPKLHCLLAHHYAWWKLGFLQTVLIFWSGRKWKPEHLKQHERHALWVIENLPGDPVTRQQYLMFDRRTNPDGYAAAKALWERHAEAHDDNALVLTNAANFFSYTAPDLAANLIPRLRFLQVRERELAPILERLRDLHGRTV